MRKCFICFVFLNIISSFFLISQASAIGLGGYVTGGYAGNNWTHEDEEYNLEESDNSEMLKYGVGFILDTAVAKDSLFNYRLNVGYCRTEMASDKLPDVKGNDFHLYNTFGFGLLRTEGFRFWVGPQFGFGLMLGKHEPLSTNKQCNALYGSLGAVAGINIHTGDLLSIGIDGGYRYNLNTGYSDVAYAGSNFTGSGHEAFACISFIFRINDNFTN